MSATSSTLKKVDQRIVITIIGKLPSGRYHVCDPSHVIQPRDWRDFVRAYDIAVKEHGSRAVIFAFMGRTCFAASTRSGDGCYRDQDGNTYDVDSGLIGAVPIEICAVQTRIAADFLQSFAVGADAHGEYICIDTHIIHT